PEPGDHRRGDRLKPARPAPTPGGCAGSSKLSPAAMNRRGPILVVASVVGIVCFLASYKYWRVSSTIAPAASFGGPAESVEVAPVRAIPWQGRASAAGTIVARESVTLSNELAGTIAQVGFSSGQIVEAGQVLVELDTRTERAE